MAIFFAGILANAAKEAGIEVPPDPDGDWDSLKFPHFAVFCRLQLGRSLISPSDVWHNAQVIAAIPKDKIKKITFEGVMGLGYR